MHNLPDELIVCIISFIKNKKVMRLVSRKFANIIDSIIFHTPTWKIRPSIEDISHLPIRILKISQIHSEFGERRPPINHLSLSLTHFILDSSFTEITPNVISDHPETTFFISTGYLTSRDKVWLSTQPNVKLFTCRRYSINWTMLSSYKDFTFSTLTMSHIEMYDKPPDILEFLSDLKIERLVLDDIFPPLDPNKLIKFQNIVHISSQVFERGKIFPLFLINKLAKLETFHCRRKTFMNFSEFKCLHKKSVSIPALHYWDYVTISNFSFNEYTLSKIFQDNGNNNVYCRISILIHLTKDPPKQLQFLQNTSL